MTIKQPTHVLLGDFLAKFLKEYAEEIFKVYEKHIELSMVKEDEMTLKLPINWSILRERDSYCMKCGSQTKFKNWFQMKYPFPDIECPACYYSLCMDGAVKDYYRES